MAWYQAWCGSWTESMGVKMIGGSYSRKEIFDKAQRVADETGRVVTISREIGSANGLRCTHYTVNPQR